MESASFPPSPFNAQACAGRVALVSGGGSGIGFEISRQIGLHGGKVAIMGRRAEVLDAAVEAFAAEGIAAVACQGDVRDYDSCVRAVETAVSAFGCLDTLINCAAGNFLSASEALSPKGFKTVMEIDAFGVFNLSKASFGALCDGYKKNGDAAIVNITAKYDRPPFFQMAPSAAKMAIDSMTRSFSYEWADYGIRSNGIAPGPIANTTGIMKLAGVAQDSFDESLPRMLRFGETWDIAMATVYLLSSAGGYISGDTLIVDGGGYLRDVPRKKNGYLRVNRDAIAQMSSQREKAQRKSATGVAGGKSKL